MEVKNFFPKNLNYLRKKNNKTLDNIAKICGKTHVAVMYWENNKREPTAIDVYNIANYFNVSVDDIIKIDLENEQETEKITPKDFMHEVLPLIDKIENLKDKEKNKLKEEIKYICEDD